MSQLRSCEERQVWVVRFGVCAFRYYTEYHAEQFVRALTLNGTPCTLESPQ